MAHVALHDLPDAAPAAAFSLSEPLLTALDVALLFGIPRSSVYEYAKRKVDPMPCVRIGRHRRFYRSDLERWLARQRA